MRCPTLNQLPPPSLGNAGWPWTEESSSVEEEIPDISLYPKFSIITPTLNQGRYIEETIRSVLLQGYPNLEYIIIDGGSEDGTLDILKKYEIWLSYWESEKDTGQSSAINKGIKRSTGDIVAWINSDDIYTPGCFYLVSKNMYNEKIPKNIILFGDCDFVNESGEYLYKSPGGAFNRNYLLRYWKAYFIPQPSTFIPGDLFRKNLLNESLNYVMDWDLWLRLSLKYKFIYLNKTLSRFKIHYESKWGKSESKFLEEQKMILHQHHKNFFLKLIFLTSFVVWKIRLLYHRFIRKIFLDILSLCVGERIFKRLENFKKIHFPYLSKLR
jgi:glycosyltransferase involved in cell wall biosynthesis